MVERVTQNSVNAAPISRERFVAADYGAGGEMIARAAEKFGGDLGVVADNVDAIQQHYDVAAVKLADAQDTVKINTLRATALNAKGFEAQSAVEGARKQIAEIAKTRLANLHTPRQRQLYSQAFGERNAQYEEQFVGHALKQQDVAMTGASAARAEASAGVATSSFDQPDIFKTNVDTVKTEIAAVHRGDGPDVIALEQRKAVSAIHAGVINNLLTDPDKTQEARAWYSTHVDELTPEDALKINKQLKPLVQADEDEVAVGRAFASSAGHPGAGPGAGPDHGGVPTDPDLAFDALIKQESSGRVGISGPQTKWGKAHGLGQVLDSTAKQMAKRLGLPWRPDLMTDTSQAGANYQLQISRAYFDEGMQRNNGDVPKALAFYHGGPDMRQHGPKTASYVQAVLGKAGATQDRLPTQEAGIAPGGSAAPASNLTRYSADHHELGPVLDQLHAIATAEHWSPQTYERRVALAKQKSSINDQIYNQRKDDLKEGAMSHVADLGDNLKSIKQIPNFGLLDPQTQISIQGMVDRNNSGTNVKADGPEYAKWRVMSVDPDQRDAFLKQDFRANPNMTAGERVALQVDQQKLRNHDTAGPTAISLDNLNQSISRYTRQGLTGITVGGAPVVPGKPVKVDEGLRQKLIDYVRPQLEQAAQAKGKALSAIEVDDIVRANVSTVVRSHHEKGWFGGDNIKTTRLPKWQAETNPAAAGESDTHVVPKWFADQLTQSYAKQGLPPPTSHDTEVWYARSLGH